MLVERIIHRVINDNIDIDKILVVTFTNAAASEMRERILDAIYKRIEKEPENEHLQKQIVLLNKANICTIHSFCLEIIRNNFFEIDIPANFRIADTAEIELLKQEVLEDLFEEKYNKNDEDFLKLIETYTSYRGDEPLKEECLLLYQYIQSNPFPEKWITEKVEMFNNNQNDDFGKSVWGNILLKKLQEKIEDGIITLKYVKCELEKYDELTKFYQTILLDIDKLNNLKKQVEISWDTACKEARKL